jgi:hypothetical protein
MFAAFLISPERRDRDSTAMAYDEDIFRLHKEDTEHGPASVSFRYFAWVRVK